MDHEENDYNFSLKNLPNSLSACYLPIPFANTCSLNPDQAQQNIGPYLDPNCLTSMIIFLKEFFENVNLKKKNQQRTISIQNNSACKELFKNGPFSYEH